MRDLILALFVFGTIPFILKRPYMGLLVWSWLGYMNPNRLTYGFAYDFPWVQLIAIVTLVSIVINRESRKIPLTAVTVLMALFFAWCTLATFFAVPTTGAWDTWSRFGKTLIMVAVTLIVVRDRERMHLLVWVIVVSLGFYGVKGGLFTALTGGSYHVWGPPQSFIASNNDLAEALCMTLPLMRYLQLQATKKAVRIGLGVGMLLTGIAVLGTYSRGGLITLAVVAGALFLKSRKRVAVVALAIVLGMVAVHFMPAKWVNRMDTLHHARQTDSAQERIQSWKFAINVAMHRPLLGGGFKVYKSAAMWHRYAPQGAIQRAVHSIYFGVLGDQGFPGLLLFLGLLVASWRSCTKVRRRTRDSPEDKWAHDLGSMLQLSLLAFMVHGLATTSSYFDLAYQMMAMCGLLLVIVANKAPRSVEKPETVRVAASARIGPTGTHVSGVLGNGHD